jgi:hypothetical protein
MPSDRVSSMHLSVLEDYCTFWTAAMQLVRGMKLSKGLFSLDSPVDLKLTET